MQLLFGLSTFSSFVLLFSSGFTGFRTYFGQNITVVHSSLQIPFNQRSSTSWKGDVRCSANWSVWSRLRIHATLCSCIQIRMILLCSRLYLAHGEKKSFFFFIIRNITSCEPVTNVIQFFKKLLQNKGNIYWTINQSNLSIWLIT